MRTLGQDFTPCRLTPVALSLGNAMANDLRQQALRLLARREHSRAELARKLLAYASAEEIDALLNELQDSRLQSDGRFAENYVRSHAARLGASRLRQTLKTKGVAAELIEAQLAQDVLPDEFERARAVWRRKYSTAPADAREWARQARFLQGRGFSGDIIARVLKQPNGAFEE